MLLLKLVNNQVNALRLGFNAAFGGWWWSKQSKLNYNWAKLRLITYDLNLEIQMKIQIQIEMEAQIQIILRRP